MGGGPVIYVLRNPDYPRLLMIGTAGWIAGTLRRLRGDGLSREDFGRVSRRVGLTLWLRRLTCVGMIEGDEDNAEALRESLWAETQRDAHDVFYCSTPNSDGWREPCRAGTPYRVATAGFLGWLATALPWDGSAAEQLGIKGLGKAAPRPVARASSLADRVKRRRS
jgi:hypothetical protein